MTAKIRDAVTGKEITALLGSEDGGAGVWSPAFSPDGWRVVAISASPLSDRDKKARIWDAASGKEITVLHGLEGEVESAAFSPEGSHIVTSSTDGTAHIWDAATGKEIMVLRGDGRAVSSAAFSPDGSRVVTALSDNTARIWDVRFATMSTSDLIAEACLRRLRGLTTLTHDEMRLAGYADDVPAIDVCARVE